MMYNYGTGCNYNYGGYIGGYGYGGYAPVAYQVPTTNGRGHNFALILVLLSISDHRMLWWIRWKQYWLRFWILNHPL